jgi:adenosylmethionine-8-amino-7-oxononanoate aminotransferase
LEADQIESALPMLEEKILNANPDQIASIMMESIVGASGCLVMPDNYLQSI